MPCQGRPVKVVAPCEGTGYEIGSQSIVKGGPNLEREEVRTTGRSRPRRRRSAPRRRRTRCLRTRTRPFRPGAEVRADQAHRLRLRQVRLLGRAQAPAPEVGHGGQGAPEVTIEDPRSRAFHRLGGQGLHLHDRPRSRPGMTRAATGWLGLAWLAFALLPWYVLPATGRSIRAGSGATPTPSRRQPCSRASSMAGRGSFPPRSRSCSRFSRGAARRRICAPRPHSWWRERAASPGSPSRICHRSPRLVGALAREPPRSPTARRASAWGRSFSAWRAWCCSATVWRHGGS